MSGRLFVSLAALADNYAYLCEHGDGAVGAVVKADGYGLGAGPIARHLLSRGCDTFFVATLAEGVALRGQCPQSRIYVFEGVLPPGVDEFVKHRLTPVLNSPAQLQAWQGRVEPVAVHVDTGMQRLGLPWEQALEQLRHTDLSIELLMSHFARADEFGGGAEMQQLSRFGQVYEALRKHHPQMQRSLCNSAGICAGLGPEHVGRGGIALYGGNPFSNADNPLQPVVGLYGEILQLRNIEAGVPVGYGGTFVSEQPMTLATVGVGYADGLPRLLSGCGRAYVAQEYRPIVGRVSMDLLSVDVTGLKVAEGDEVELIGRHIGVDEVAGHARTIGYEILTGLGRRLPRTYSESPLP